MQPLSELTGARARELRALLFDLDDTFLDRGRLFPEALAALYALEQSGLGLIAVTGRPAGWADVFVRQWPLRAAVAENGALWLVPHERQVLRCDPVSAQTRAERQQALHVLLHQVLQHFPGLCPAEDNWARVTDIALDIGETRHLGLAEIEALDAFCREKGAYTTRSTVHLHASFDSADKAVGAKLCAAQVLGIGNSDALGALAFVGDSPNDGACFSALECTFGVANVREHLAALPKAPRYVAQAERAAGFVEIAQRLVQLRAEAL